MRIEDVQQSVGDFRKVVRQALLRAASQKCERLEKAARRANQRRDSLRASAARDAGVRPAKLLVELSHEKKLVSRE